MMSAAPSVLTPERAPGGVAPAHELTLAQRDMWLRQQALGWASFSIGLVIDIDGPLRGECIQQAVDELARAEPMLRARIDDTGADPTWRVEPTVHGYWSDRRAPPGADPEAWADTELQQLRERGFDPRLAPAWHVSLLQLTPTRWRLVLAFNHLLLDGYGVKLFAERMGARYNALLADAASPAPPPGPAGWDRPARERDYLASPRAAKDLAFWQQRLPEPQHPTAHPPPAASTAPPLCARWQIDAGRWDALAAAAQALGLSVAQALSGLLALYIARIADSADVCVALPLHNRLSAEDKQTLGLFVNVLPLIWPVPREQPLAGLLQAYAAEALQLLRHQRYPVDALLKRQPPRQGVAGMLFDLMLSVEDFHSEVALAGVAARYRGFSGHPAIAPVAAYVRRYDAHAAVTVDVVIDSRAPAPLRHTAFLAARLDRLLDHLLTRAEQPLLAADLIGAREAAVIAAANATARAHPGPQRLHELVWAQAQRTPQARAALSDRGELTYAELREQALDWAAALAARGIGPGDFIPLFADRQLALLPALLGVLHAGAACVPLDPDLPAARAVAIAAQCHARLLLTDPPRAAALRAAGLPAACACLRVDTPAPAGPRATPRQPGADDPAMVIFTSGSTGQPKGVLLPHRALVNHKHWNARLLDFGPADRVLHKTTLGFDAALWEMFVPWMRGGCVYLAAPGQQRDLPALLRTVQRWGITHLTLAPSTAAALADLPELRACHSLRCVLFGGEPLAAALARRIQSALPQARLLNFYGPSEATEDSTAAEIDAAALADDGVLPIGRPVDNTRVHVLDADGRVQPLDVPGELCIGGAGVALGYLHRPELTAERFVPDPFCSDPGARLYRSGDIGWLRADGQLVCLGRNDHQVEIRGHRVKPGEIENRLSARADIAQAAVIAHDFGDSSPVLCAYLVARPGQPQPDFATLRGALAQTLPGYMVPASWQWLDALPLTSSGKVDRRALPAPRRPASAESVPPRTDTERRLQAIWTAVLGSEPASVHDHFFALGGHSLHLVQVRSRLGGAVELSTLFAHPTIASLAAYLDQQPAPRQPGAGPTIAVQPRGQPLPVSLSQRRMWVIQQFDPHSTAYNVNVALRLRGRLDPAALRAALAYLVQRHEGLRTHFVLGAQEPLQVIAPTVAYAIEEKDLRALPAEQREGYARQILAARAAQPYDLSQPPLFRVALLQLQDDEHVLFWSQHHAISDNWSLALLCSELLRAYADLRDGRAPGLPALTLGYADYACWQRSEPATREREPQMQYWLQHLRGLPDLPLPTDLRRVARPSFAGSRVSRDIDPALQQAMRDYSASRGVSPFMIWFAAWAAWLARVCRASDFGIGVPVANRDHPATQHLVGTLVNTLVMRCRVDTAGSFDQLVAQVQREALEAFAHPDAPFDELVERLRAAGGATAARNPVRVLLNVNNAPIDWPQQAALAAAPFDFERVTAQFDLELSIETERWPRVHLDFATDLYTADTARRWLDSLLQLLPSLLAAPEQPLARHSLLTAEQRQQLAACNATARPVARPRSLPAALALDAPALAPRIALVDAAGATLTYGELHTRARTVAAALRQRGIGRGAVVGLCLHRDRDLLPALLGVLYAGAAYLPLDPAFPRQRLLDMLADAQPAAVLIAPDLQPPLAGTAAPLLPIDATLQAPPLAAAELPAIAPEDPAYLLYTSGSTGRPKGVLVPHRAVVNFLDSMADCPGLSAGDTLLAVTTLSFDISVLELLLPLWVGARIALATREQAADPRLLAARLARDGVTVLQATPSTWRLLLAGGWNGSPALKALVGGEPLPADLAARLLPRVASLWNLYGPTETTVWSTVSAVTDGAAPMRIGRPIANTQVWVVDPGGQPCPIGAPGEICIGGEGVALGYLHRPELTSERFIPDPFSTRPGARLYRTGDLGRWTHDGQLEHLGRLDHQVKIRGHRVELGEVESALRTLPGVADAVAALAGEGGEAQLVGYLVAAAGATAPDLAAVRAALRANLPDYMLPQRVMALPALPRLPNGKIDRQSLPLPAPAAVEATAPLGAADPVEAPRTPLEAAIARIWAELLGLDPNPVRRDDNFFDLGGHSLQAAHAALLIEQRTGLSVHPRRLVHETLAQIARPSTGHSAGTAPQATMPGTL